MNMEWVKCNDRLPELKDDGVIVYFGLPDHSGFCGHAVETVHIEDYFKDITNGVDDSGVQLYTKWYLSMGVTHWMALPEIPE